MTSLWWMSVPRRALAVTTVAARAGLSTPATSLTSMRQGRTLACAALFQAPTRPSNLTTPEHMPQAHMSYQKRKQKAMKKMAQQQKARTPMKRMQQLQKEYAEDQHLELDSLGKLADYWVPIPKEHRSPIFSLEGIRERWEHLRKTIRTTFSIGTIRYKDRTFRPIEFAQQIQENLVKLQSELAKSSRSGEKFEFWDLVTAQAYSQLQKEHKMPHVWEFVSEIDRPRVVAAFTFPVEEKSNLYAQVTVKLHIRSRYGRLGEAMKETDAIEYIVAERHLANPEAKWRICSKLVPFFSLPKDQQASIKADMEKQRLENKKK